MMRNRKVLDYVTRNITMDILEGTIYHTVYFQVHKVLDVTSNKISKNLKISILLSVIWDENKSIYSLVCDED